VYDAIEQRKSRMGSDLFKNDDEVTSDVWHCEANQHNKNVRREAAASLQAAG